MTSRSDIEALVQKWAPRMGLGHWEIDVDWSRPCGPDDDAEFAREDFYDIATLRFNAKCAEWTREHAERVVVHELLHLVTRDLDGVVSMAHELLPEDARRLAEKHYERAIEGVVERVAVTICSALPRPLD